MNPDKYRDKMVFLAKNFTTYAEKILGFASWSVCYYTGNIPVEYSLPEPLCTYVIDIEKNGELVPIYLYPLVKKSPCKKGKDLYIGLEVDGKMIGTYFTNEQIEWYGDILLFESFKTAIGADCSAHIYVAGSRSRNIT